MHKWCWGGFYIGSEGSPGRVGVCACVQTGHRDTVHAGTRAEDGSWQRALPQPNFGLPDLDFLLPIPLEFQLVVRTQPKCCWLSVIHRPVITGSISHQGLRRAQTLALLDGVHQALIFSFICYRAFFRTWLCTVSSSWFESATAGYFSAISGYYSADLSWSLPSSDLVKLGLNRWSWWNKTFFLGKILTLVTVLCS